MRLSILSNATLKINNPLITNKYIYNYQYCNNKCTNYKDIVSVDVTKNNNTLLILEYEYNIDSNDVSSKYQNIKNIINDFAKIKYLDNAEIKYEKVRVVTPDNLKDKLVLEIPSIVKDLNNYDLAIIIRNKEYNIIIK